MTRRVRRTHSGPVRRRARRPPSDPLVRVVSGQLDAGTVEAMDHANPDSQGDRTTVVLERAIRHVEDELRGAPEEQVVARLRAELPTDVDVPEHNLLAAARAIAEGRREDGTPDR